MLILHEERFSLVKKILSDKYHPIQVKTISVLDDLESAVCRICLSLTSGEALEFSGVGMVDAIFTGLKGHYSSRYKSLLGLELIRFFVAAKSAGTEAEVEVEIQIRNSYGKKLYFKDNSRSLIASAARVSTSVIEYFINSEQAFLLLCGAVKDARCRGREDLVTRYEAELAQLVENTGYTEVLNEAS